MKSIKKLIGLSLILFTLQSCATLIGTSVILVDTPGHAKYSYNGTPIGVKKIPAVTENDVTYIYYGLKMKAEKEMNITVEYGGVKKTVSFETKRPVLLLVTEGFLTFGIATIIDLASGNAWRIKSSKTEGRYLDIPAILNDDVSRTQPELREEIIEQVISSNKK